MYKDDFYRELPEHPPGPSASNMIARMLDGLGFRLYWSLDGLLDEQCSFRPCEGAKSIHETIWHIWKLVNWIHASYHGKDSSRPGPIIDQGKHALELIYGLRNEFLHLDDDNLANVHIGDRAYWNLVNAPIADALSHVGQINILRRMAGNPAKIGKTIN